MFISSGQLCDEKYTSLGSNARKLIFGMISLSVDPFFECRQLCLNSHGVLKVRTGHESVNQSQPCCALPHQAKGSTTEIRSSAHEQDVSTLTGT